MSALVVDSDRASADRVVAVLRGAVPRLTTIISPTLAEACRLIPRASVDFVILSESFGSSGPGVPLKVLREQHPALPVVVLADAPSIAGAVLAMRLGAFDYLGKHGDDGQRLVSIAREIDEARPCRAPSRGATVGGPRVGPPHGSIPLACIIGESRAIREVRRQIVEVGPSDVPVLILGETGTGKGLAARAIHEASSRRGADFVDVDCAEFQEDLFGAEVFGHVRGAYTGAYNNSTGIVRGADGGTLFLDEIGELTLPQQAKLLRMAEDGKVRPIGATTSVKIDARIVAATNRDLRQGIVDGTFRADLYHRLAVVTIEMPPLRRRPEDIPLLLEALLVRHVRSGSVPRVSEAAVAQLQQADWPGNVRELDNVIQHALVRCRCGVIDRFDIHPLPSRPVEAPPPERATFELLLRRWRGDLHAIAAELKVDVRTVQRRLKALGLRRRDFRPAT